MSSWATISFCLCFNRSILKIWLKLTVPCKMWFRWSSQTRLV
jgi:hypothetical protein